MLEITASEFDALVARYLPDLVPRLHILRRDFEEAEESPETRSERSDFYYVCYPLVVEILPGEIGRAIAGSDLSRLGQIADFLNGWDVTAKGLVSSEVAYLYMRQDLAHEELFSLLNPEFQRTVKYIYTGD